MNKKLEEEIKKELKNSMNEALESINADGQIKTVSLDMDKMTVNFEFELIEIDNQYYFFGW